MQDAFTVLMVVQMILSFLMALIYIVVRVPSNLMSNLENGKSIYISTLNAITDPLPAWYLCFFILSVLAYTVDKIYVVGFLLDWIVLDATTRDVLKAVQYPARQLFATLVTLVITLHIFSAFYFIYFPIDLQAFHLYPIDSLWNSFKLAISYGIRGEYGMAHELEDTLGSRMLLDLVFYFVILAILRQILLAVIVDTFGKLRELKYERDEKLHNSCFICGVERHDFEKAGLSHSFAFHRYQIHKLENYVFFIFSILEQPVVEDMGIEMHIRKAIQNLDISWLPIGYVYLYFIILLY